MATKKKSKARDDTPLSQDELGEYKEVPLERVGTEDIPIVFTDNVVIFHVEDAFFINFYQNQAPIITSEEDVKSVDKVRSKCVGRYIITPSEMKKFLASLNSNVERYEERMSSAAVGGEK